MGATPTVTCGATSLKEGGTGQRQIHNQEQAFDLDLALDQPPSLREGAAQQPGGSCTRPADPTFPRVVSPLVRA